ncbi:hypothetical protein J2X69_002715 [Algoriphagus sp. 4150]|uniref:hypothetical protein n=1 Tax=Algoriphagus sp. 4150 TaxID=2817756 RepID=UPI00285AC8A2|nr:hypothetical protein [Algoriphagus sp. 4150]MDR7130365.1 hypothetical protein [Algoriphagus sp. 4150]
MNIKDIKGPCFVVLTDDIIIVSSGNIEFSKRTQAIAYSDEEGKIWSLFKDDYTGYSYNGSVGYCP